MLNRMLVIPFTSLYKDCCVIFASEYRDTTTVSDVVSLKKTRRLIGLCKYCAVPSALIYADSNTPINRYKLIGNKNTDMRQQNEQLDIKV